MQDTKSVACIYVTLESRPTCCFRSSVCLKFYTCLANKFCYPARNQLYETNSIQTTSLKKGVTPLQTNGTKLGSRKTTYLLLATWILSPSEKIFPHVTVSRAGQYDTSLSPTLQHFHGYYSYSHYFPVGYQNPSVPKL